MTRKCVIEGCPSRSGNSDHRGVTFHSFPLDPKIRTKWIENCRIHKDKNLTKSILVCSRHFRRADFQPIKSSKYLLKIGTAPTIFPWGKLPPNTIPDLSKKDAAVQQQSSEHPGTAEGTADIATSDVIPSLPELKEETLSVVETAGKKKRSSSAVEHAESDNDVIKLKMPKLTLEGNPAPVQSTSPAVLTPEGSRLLTITSPSKQIDLINIFAAGNRLEAQAFDGVWHTAKVVEVDNDEREVLIRFEKTGKGNKSSSNSIEEWIPMNSSRLRQKATNSNSKPSAVFTLNEKCLARWSGPKKFPGTVTNVLDNGTYEILFDDGYSKVVRGIHMSKIQQTADKLQLATTKANTSGSNSSTKSTNVTADKDHWPLIKISSLNLDELNLPHIPQDGEWCCHWVNDQPIGREGFLTVGDHRKPTVIVDDWRLPPYWTKHMYQRSNVLGKWDVILINPSGKRFRSKADLKQCLEEMGQQYNPDIYDFSIHRRRAKDIGAYVYTKDYKPPPPVPASSSYPTLKELENTPLPSLDSLTAKDSSIVAAELVSGVGGEQTASTTTNVDNETLMAAKDTSDDGFVRIGSLKVQIVDNLFRCPEENCNKNFRKENHLQIHVKHYHRDIAKLLGVCPNMQDLALKRTLGEQAEEPLPKNHLPNAKFFAQAHQQDLQLRAHRRVAALSTPTTNISQSTSLNTTNDSNTFSEFDDSKMLATGKELTTSAPTVQFESIKKGLESDFNTEKLISSQIFAHATGDSVDALETETLLRHEIKVEAPTTSSKVSTTAGITTVTTPKVGNKFGNKFKKKKPKQKNHKRWSTTLKKARSTSNSFNASFDLEETRHSFNTTPEVKQTAMTASTSKKPSKLLVSPSITAADSMTNQDAISHTTGSYHDNNSKSPQYINENGEIIKIVRMRQEEIINCLCTYGEEDGLMIQCELCLCWQHGICNGIENQSQVPEKYVCYICRNPPRGRASCKYVHDQDWMYTGKLAGADYHAPHPKLLERFETLRKSHELTGNLIDLKRFMHSLKVKINIALDTDHPKMYLWARKWESSPPKLEKKEEKNVTTEETDENVEQKIVVKEELTVSALDNNSQQQLIDETANDVKMELKTENPKMENFSPITPEPAEAAIDPIECQRRLFDHIQKQQSYVMDRLDQIESKIMELEGLEDNYMEPSDCPKTKQSISLLIRDLEIMKNLGKINVPQAMYASTL